jgi:hypothetical protein
MSVSFCHIIGRMSHFGTAFVKDKQTQVGSDKKTTQKQKQNKNKYNFGKNYWN